MVGDTLTTLCLVSFFWLITACMAAAIWADCSLIAPSRPLPHGDASCGSLPRSGLLTADPISDASPSLSPSRFLFVGVFGTSSRSIFNELTSLDSFWLPPGVENSLS